MKNDVSGSASGGRALAVTRWAALTVCGLFGVFLLLATKIAAGVSVVCATLIMAFPLARLSTNKRLLLWTRTILVTGLLALATWSISTTDVPGEMRTGSAPADKLSSIWQSFRRNVLGEGTPSEPGGEITLEMVKRNAQCLREHGLPDLPEPQLTEDGITIDFSKVRESEEVIRAAQEACRHVLSEGR